VVREWLSQLLWLAVLHSDGCQLVLLLLLLLLLLLGVSHWLLWWLWLHFVPGSASHAQLLVCFPWQGRPLLLLRLRDVLLLLLVCCS
jgi:hypothetical protein